MIAGLILCVVLFLIFGGGGKIRDTFRPPENAEHGTRLTWGDYIDTPEGQEALRKAREFDRMNKK